MIFSQPIPFAEALAYLRQKAILPTDLSSRQLSQIAPALRERALFSARTDNARHLQTISAAIDDIVSGRISQPEARLRLQESLDAISYTPAPSQAGTLRDLGSDQRLNLIIETNTRMAHGYGYWAQGQDQAVLDLWPAQEFIRVASRVNERPDWRTRWFEAGGHFYDSRMIAPKNSSVWTRLSAFGLPYPPFDFNSGMGVRDIRRDEAIRLGVIEPGARIPPERRPFNDDLEASPPAPPQTPLFAALLESLGKTATFVNGVLRLISPGGAA